MLKKFIKDITGATAREAKARSDELARLELVKKANDSMIKKAKAEAKKKEREEKKQKEKELKEAEELARLNSPKQKATDAGEPYIAVINVLLDFGAPDSNDLGEGAFELDWNDIFVARLIKAGYPGKTDADVVDNWFKDVCRNVVLETYEQEIADPEKRR